MTHISHSIINASAFHGESTRVVNPTHLPNKRMTSSKSALPDPPEMSSPIQKQHPASRPRSKAPPPPPPKRFPSNKLVVTSASKGRVIPPPPPRNQRSEVRITRR